MRSRQKQGTAETREMKDKGRSVSPEHIRKQIKPRLLRSEPGLLPKEAYEFLFGEINALLTHKNTYLCNSMAEFTRDIDDEILNQAFIFEGYEGKTRKALLDLLIYAACNGPQTEKKSVYRALKFFDFPETMDFLIKQALVEKDYDKIAAICDSIIRLTEDLSESEKDQILEKFEYLLFDECGLIRYEFMYLFFNFGTKKGMKRAVEAFLKEEDEEIIVSMYDAFGNPKLLIEVLDEEYDRFVVEVIKTKIRKAPSFIDKLFVKEISNIRDIEKFVEMISEEDYVFLSDLFQSKDVVSNQFDTSFRYFKAAYNKSLIEVEVEGERFKYCLSSMDEFAEEVGQCCVNAIVISDKIPKIFRPIVAYHEYIEGKTGSHEEAVKKEQIAARNMGLEKEFKEWLDSIEEFKRY